MRRPPFVLAVPSLLALLALGCDSNPLQPEELAGAYVLQSINGDALPAETYEDANVSFTLLADTLRLQADGSGTQVQVTRTDWTDPAKPDGVTSAPSTLRYEVRGRRIVASYGCVSLPAAGPAWGGAAARDLIGGDSVLGTSCVQGRT